MSVVTTLTTVSMVTEAGLIVNKLSCHVIRVSVGLQPSGLVRLTM